MGFGRITGKAVQAQPRRTRSRQETTVGAAVLSPTNEGVSNAVETARASQALREAVQSAVERAQAEQELQNALQGARNRRLNERLGVGTVTTVNPAPSVSSVTNSRFQPRVTEDGFTVVQTREATDDERASRRRSRDERLGNLSEATRDGDYTLLPSSLRDLYLTGSHGITSLYPSILITAPRTGGIVDTATGMSASPFIIDVNNEVKKSIENSVISQLNQYGPVLGLSNTQYNANLSVAKDYADLCLQTALIKDRLISLTNIINTDPTENLNSSQNIVIGDAEYQYLKNLPDVLSFMQSIDEKFSLETFTQGNGDSVNTKSLAQILKIFYNQFIVGSLDTGLGQPRDNELIFGNVDYNINKTIKSLLTITPGANLDVIDAISQDDFRNIDTLTDLVRIIGRDLIMQSSEAQIREVFPGSYATAQDFLSQIIGSYKDLYQNDSTIGFFKTGFTTIDDFTDSTSVDVSNLLVRREEDKKYNILDSVGGHDYLLYKELVDEQNAVTLDNLKNFTNSYSQFAIKLRLIYQAFYRNDEIRRKCLQIIATNFLTFFTNGQLTRTEFTSLESAARTAALFGATKDQVVASWLFYTICKQNNSQDSDELKDYLRTVVWSYGDESSNGNLRVGGSISGDDEGYFRLYSDYLRSGADTSFGMFYTIVDQIDNALASANLEGVERKTTYSLGLTKDARVYVFYQLFLDILRNFYFDVDYREIGYKQVRLRYKTNQYDAIIFALENWDKSTEEFNRLVNSKTFSTSDNDKYQDDAKYFHSRYIAAITSKVNEQEQNCLDIVNLISNHAAQMTQITARLQANINDIKRAINDNNLNDKESILNSIQSEQAYLKKNIIDRYSYLLKDAPYLPSAVDHNTSQAINTKTVVQTKALFADPVDTSLTRKFLIVIGLPSGLLESLRYENSFITSEHLYNIDLIFRNTQITEIQEGSGNIVAIKSYKFSSRIFVNEGSQVIGGADTKAESLTTYSQIAAATKYKVIDDQGNYVDVSPDQLTEIIGIPAVVENHLNSHYGKLFLKTVTGISVDEEIFDLIPQTRTYPDLASLPNYTTLVDLTSGAFDSTAESQLNKARVLRDMSRAVQLSPMQHMTSMMTSKTFERIHVIPVDIQDLIDDPVMRLTSEDVAFISVTAKISLSETQPAVVLEAPRRTSSSSNSLGERGDGQVTTVDIEQFDPAEQSVSSVGIEAFLESSSRFGGMLGGYRR